MTPTYLSIHYFFNKIYINKKIGYKDIPFSVFKIIYNYDVNVEVTPVPAAELNSTVPVN